MITKEFDAVIFDLDGVITQSAKLHAQAWKEMFDQYLIEKNQPPFDIQSDYLTYVDGKPRLEGIRSFLQSRNIEEKNIEELGKKKNEIFLKLLKEKGVKVFPSSVELVYLLKDRGFKVAIVTSSKNCDVILKSAKIADLFDIQVDGIKSAQLKLKGKPEPDIFLQAAKELGVDPKKAVIIEDSLAGVQAGRSGKFGYIIGIDRNKSKKFAENGADLVVQDLKEVQVER